MNKTVQNGFFAFLLLFFVLPFENIMAIQDQQPRYTSAQASLVSSVEFEEMFYKVKLDKQIDINVENETVEKALRRVAVATGLKLTYRGDIMSDKKVTLNRQKIGVTEALSLILEDTGLDYKFSKDGYLLVHRKFKELKAVEFQEEVEGRVTDATTGESLPGVNVIVKGTTTGTSTDAEGTYELTVESLQDTLVFSFVGYQTQEVPINGRTEVDVRLQSQAISGEELVVVGYGALQRRDITGSVGKVEVDNLSQGVSSSVDNMMIGKSAGVNVVQNSGEPGSGFSVNIRGAGSINASNSPLYVIDGVPISNQRSIQGTGTEVANPRGSRSPLASLNPEDIESIEILKDASATAIYGSRGANGVVMITTKSGRSGDLHVDYHGYIGLQNRSNKLDLLSAEEYKQVINDIIDDRGTGEEFRVGEIRAHTDWQDELNNPNALVQNQQLSFSGGSENTTYHMSLNYMDQEGTQKFSHFTRYSARINLESEISEKLNVGLNLTTAHTNDDFLGTGAGINENAGALYAAYNMDPTMPIRNPDGSYVRSPVITIDNPMALARGIDGKSDFFRTFGSVFAEFDFTSNLYGRINLGGNVNDESRKTYISTITFEGSNNNGVGTLQEEKANNYLIEGTLHFNQTFGGVHDVQGMAGVTFERFLRENVFQSASNFPTDAVGANNLGLGDADTYVQNTNKTGSRLGSYLGRINYSFDDKYLVTTTLRVDGSSRFGENNRFAVFPSVALGWRLKQESFLADVEALSSLKLRGSWGRNGNQEIGDYPSIATFQQGQTAVWNGQPITTTTPSRIPNPDLKWEVTEQVNFGLDFGFLNDRLSGSIDYYQKVTSDMLLNLPIPTSSGFNTRLSNIGEIQNSGFEFSLNSTNISGNDFVWSSSLTLSTINNEVKDLGGIPEIIVGGAPFSEGQVAIIRPGDPLYSFYGYEITGVWQEGDDFSVTTDNVSPGDLKFRDVNNDGTVNSDDRVLLGDSFPDLSISFGNTFNYKNMELFMFVEAVQGIEMLNANKMETYFPINFPRNKFAEPYLNRWTPQNPSNKYPSFVTPFNQGVKVINNYVVEDASYVKLRTLRLSYNLPRFTEAFRSATVYVTGENLITLTGYDGIDPAINANANANYRIDLNAYPSARSFMLGLRLGL